MIRAVLENYTINPKSHLVRKLLRPVTMILFVASSGLYASAQERTAYAGVVLDSAGAAIANATVDLEVPSGRSRANTDASGRFTVLVRSDEIATAILIVSAPGFSSARIRLAAGETRTSLEARLAPQALLARVSVSIDERSTQPNQVTLDESALRRSGAITLDDALRQVPGFSLFRRSGSLTANPTSQGVSLRGVGASGASRALVMLDGVPLNNPFGGWVYWNRIPRESIATVNTVNGATSDAYGGGGLGGVINIETKPIEKSFFDSEVSFANQATPSGSVSGGVLVHGVGITASAQALRTGGYILVPPGQRGLVDTPAGTGDVFGSLRISRRRTFLRLSSFGESRRNGTPMQVNNTRIAAADLGWDRNVDHLGELSLRLFGSHEVFNQDFSAVSVDRNAESLTNRQRNPSQQFGLVFQWRRVFAGRHAVVAGAEVRDVRGHSAENTFNAGRVTAHVDGGGRQRTVALFGQDSFQVQKWIIAFGARIDRWVNSEGYSNRIPIAGAPAIASFLPRSEVAISPRLSISRKIGASVWATASAYKAFRAPTLNELYRNFRVGNIVTNANADLRAERLTGGEVGLNLRGLSDRLSIRGDLFWSQINGPVANVTLTSTPTLITRQRQNLGAIRARGFETAVEFRANKYLTIGADYLLTDSTVLRFPVNPALEGLLVPQIPRHQISLQSTFARDKWSAGIQGRFISTQFDDDQNLLPLKAFFTVDAQLSRELSRSVELFVAVQNLTNTRYQVARSPVINIGPPALARLGLRIHTR